VVATQAVVARERADSEELAGRARTLLETLADRDASGEALTEAPLTLGAILITGESTPVNQLDGMDELTELVLDLLPAGP
jgi:hypothetical protein